MKDNEDVDPRKDSSETREGTQVTLVAGLDCYLENGLMVFTGHFLLCRGYCCNSGCRHCPYEKGQHRLR